MKNYKIIESQKEKHNCECKAGDRVKRIVIHPQGSMHGNVVLHDGTTDIKIYDSSLNANRPFEISLDLKLDKDLKVTTGENIKVVVIGE